MAPGGKSSHWNTGYANSITGFSDSGSSTITLTLTQQDGGTLTTSFSNPQGTVTSVGFSHQGDAFTTGGAPVTSNGTIAITMAGTSSQYINGAGNLTTFPSIPQGDITAVVAGNKLTGGGTSGSVTLGLASNNISQWTNDTGFTTNTGTTTETNTKTFTNKSGNISQWTKNSGYITSASLPTVNDATITIAAGNKLTG